MCVPHTSGSKREYFSLFCFLQSHLEASHAAELAAVEEKYTKVSKHIGLGHRQAQLVQEVYIQYTVITVHTALCYRKRGDFTN